MEGNVMDIFRVLSGVFGWGLPALLVLTLAVFVVTVPFLTLAGAYFKAKDAITGKNHVTSRRQAEIRTLERMWR